MNRWNDTSGDSHPTVVNIEFRQAWDGAWYPLVAQEGEPSFASHYVDSAQYFWELAASRTRKDVIISLSPGTTEQAIELGHAPLELRQTAHSSISVANTDIHRHSVIAQMPPLPCGTLPLEALETQAAPEFLSTPTTEMVRVLFGSAVERLSGLAPRTRSKRH